MSDDIPGRTEKNINTAMLFQTLIEAVKQTIVLLQISKVSENNDTCGV